MKNTTKLILATADAGLLAHWHGAFGKVAAVAVTDFEDLQHLSLTSASIVLLDLALPGVPKFSQPDWVTFLNAYKPRLVATSSYPKDDEAIQALDAGCAGYCHAFSDATTLNQISQVVAVGHVWIGKTLMQRLVQSAAEVARIHVSNHVSTHLEWHKELTNREQEVAILAANAASNSEIAQKCNISERTVKAHLSSAFMKLNLTDRLQLALRVHGIS